MIRKRSFKKGDRVVRNKAVGGELRADMTGTVRHVTAVPRGARGTRARVRVLWDNGHEASVEDRQLLLAEYATRST
jgi:hypothetical protein